MKHFLRLKDFNRAQLEKLLSLSAAAKKNPAKYKNALKDKKIGLLFEKPSLRTRVSCELAVCELGAYCIYLSPSEVQIGKREAIKDVARTISRYMDGLVIRTFAHQGLVEFTRYASIPVVNGLSDMFHPLQVLGDFLTIREIKGTPKGLKLAYIGDGNNVCNSLMYAATVFGLDMSIASPKGYQPDMNVAFGTASAPKNISVVESPAAAAEDADVLYTDVWVSMGEEAEQAERRRVFKEYQINDKLVSVAKKDCIVMHCLPAHRGEEITDSVIDGKHSVVFQQAENRLHSQKALFMEVFK